MFCIQCGANIADGSKFCPQCGMRFTEGTPAAAGPGRTAPPPLPPRAGVTPASAPVPPASPLVNAPPSQPVYTGPQQTDGKAVGSLILGILSFLAPILCSIPAVILGHISRSQIRKSMGRLKGEGMALAGLIMGYMSVAFIPILLIIAAIAIPNLLRSRMAANDSAAAQTIRTLVTNQIMYSTTYPEAGYAPDLATLGPGPGGSCTGASTAEHACLIDNVLGNSRCAAGTWCTRDAFNFTISATEGKPATNFVAAATPANANSGTRSYCATADGVVRSQRGLITTPPTVQECLAWESL